MKVNKLFLAALVATAAVALTGCVVTGTVHEHYREPRAVYVAPPPPGPVYVAPAPAYAAPAPSVIVVQSAPPPVIVERRPPHPGGSVIWVDGYYEPRGRDWVWISGHYAAPPRAGAVWVPPRYERRGSEVHFSVGIWR